MPHRNSSTRNDYERKINYDWPTCDILKNAHQNHHIGLDSSTKQCINSLTTNVSHQIETSQLICHANQLTGFYIMRNIGCEWVNL